MICNPNTFDRLIVLYQRDMTKKHIGFRWSSQRAYFGLLWKFKTSLLSIQTFIKRNMAYSSCLHTRLCTKVVCHKHINNSRCLSKECPLP